MKTEGYIKLAKNLYVYGKVTEYNFGQYQIECELKQRYIHLWIDHINELRTLEQVPQEAEFLNLKKGEENMKDKSIKLIKKQKDHAFGKDTYLLGRNENNDLVWLEEASWDCDWYWGFGYMQTYEGNTDPSKAVDISSHTHYDSAILQKRGVFHINSEEAEWKATTLTDSEAWTLSELMQTFYSLRDVAELYHRGSANFGHNPLRTLLKNPKKAKEINKVILPKVFEAVYELITSKNKGE